MLLGGGQQAAGISENAAILPQLAPGLAALLMVLIFRKDGLRLSLFDKAIKVRRYLLAFLVPIGGALITYPIAGAISGTLNFGIPANVPWTLLIWFPFGALGEEAGWRGYMHERIDRGLPGLFSSIVIGTMWALWHVGIYANGLVYVAFFLLLMISYSVLIYALAADIQFNILVAAIFHMAINLTNMFSFNIINSLEFIITNSLVWAGIALAVFLARRTQYLGAGNPVDQPAED